MYLQTAAFLLFLSVTDAGFDIHTDMLYLQTAVFFLVVSVLSLAEAFLPPRALDVSGSDRQLHNNSEIGRLNVSSPGRNSSVECLRTLKKDGVLKEIEVDTEFSRRNSSIALALERNDSEAAASILHQRWNASNMTLLHYAAQEGKPGSARCFIKEGIDVNSRDIYGLTPLHLAALLDYIDVVKILVESNASLWSRSNKGFLPVHYASLLPPPSILYHKDIVDYLEKKMREQRL